METIKFHTDLEQSKVLAKILPLESADIHWSKDFDGSWFVDLTEYTSVKIPKYVDKVEEHLLPCWSLAALLSILHNKTKDIPSLSGGGYKDGKYTSDWCLDYEFENGDYQTTFADNPVDACYNMIIKLNELNLLCL